IGDYAKSNNIRLTMHPAQFCVLSSKSEDVVSNAFGELNHHCEILDRMGLGKNSVIIIHGGGVYGNKSKALQRLEENILNLPKNTRDRLVLENCEMSYTVHDLLPLSEKLKVPIVIDYHHDSIYESQYPIEHYHERVFNVWIERGIKPKVHISNSIPGIEVSDTKTARRKHSDYIQYIHQPLLNIKFPIDVMLECKMKEQALLRLIQK
ncbi:UV DNA damage repair endonuclease UvsE, partial [bacterium]|nr:UV DNA damage repair endonuclease UvsE [bacterium]